MIKLETPITITPPPFTNEANQIVRPGSITLDVLNVSYVDTPSNKNLVAYINGLPGSFTLFSGQQYDIIGNWTQEQADRALRSQLGSTTEEIKETLQSLYPRTLEQNPNGPGSILTGMISSLGIKSTSNCSCRRHALEMNDKGPDWCDQNMPTILSWLKEESAKRNLPYVEMVAKAMVQRAINKSRRLLQQEQANEQA
jgi:hypothetical protein